MRDREVKYYWDGEGELIVCRERRGEVIDGYATGEFMSDLWAWMG